MSFRLTSRGLVGILAACVATGCQIEYDLRTIEDPAPLCGAPCIPSRQSAWHNPGPEPWQAGHAVEIVAWGHDVNADADTEEGLQVAVIGGATVNKRWRSAAAGAPGFDQGRVYVKRPNKRTGRLKSKAPQVLEAPRVATMEFGYSLLAADVRRGYSYVQKPQGMGPGFAFVGNRAFGEELIVGAPGTNDETGEIYVYQVTQGVKGIWALHYSYVAPGVVGGDRFGQAMAAPHLPDAAHPNFVDTLVPEWIAVSAPGGGDVYILTVVDTGTPVVHQVIHSLNGGNAFGAALAIADFNDDGINDLAVGDPGHPGGGAVHIYTGDGAGGVDTTNSLLQVSPESFTVNGAAVFGSSLAAGTFSPSDPLRAGLVVGDPGFDNEIGMICTYLYDGVLGGALTTTLSKCHENPNAESQSQWGAAIAVGNFVAQDLGGGEVGSCALAEEVAVGAPGAWDRRILTQTVVAAGKTVILAQGEDGPEPSEAPTRTFYGNAPHQGLGSAIASDHIQLTPHEDLLIGSPFRNGNRGSMTLTKAIPAGGINDEISGIWEGDDSLGDAFRVSLPSDGSHLQVTLMEEATLRLVDGLGNVCNFLATDLAFEGSIPIDPLPWSSFGVDHVERVILDISDEIGFAGVIEGDLSFDAASHTFTLSIDESAGVLFAVTTVLPNCTVEGGPIRFDQVEAFVCEL